MDSPARPSQAKMASSTGGTEGSSPSSSPASAASLAAMAAPKFGTLVPNRIFVGGISASTSEAELAQLFSAYGNVKATKIIADRGGVSKGYGFVTFETEEEAKRLQQESECIILKERKLNIAPAIKKQPFNRSFDGGTGSPPAVPTSTYYYANGMGLPYQNGMTFYNAGAPAPGATIAPPTDPTALYQAAGVFGPQPTASHQTFAPMMYPVPAPSLYMPQQYQYSPMPYEPYFQGTTAAGAPQFLYTTNSTQGNSGGGGSSGNGSGNNNSGTVGGGVSAATSPVSVGAASSLGPSAQQFQAHFYGPAATNSHHHPGVLTGAPHPAPPQHQMEHLYYSYPPPPHAAQGPPHHAGQIALAADQQLLVYATEITGQSSLNDSQISQEDTRSTSSHSEQLQQSGGGAATSDAGGGGGGSGGSHQQQTAAPATSHPSDSSAQTVIPIMPMNKHPWSNRHPNFQPLTLQSPPQQSSSQSPQQHQTNANLTDNNNENEGLAHYTIYPSPLYIPHRAQYHHPGSGNSLLPTPPQQPYTKTGFAGGSYSKSGPIPGASALIHQHQATSAYVKQFNGPPLQAPAKYPRVTTPPARLSHHHQYGKRGGANVAQQFFSPKSCPRPGQQFIYGAQPYAMSAAAPTAGLPRAYSIGSGYEYANGRRSVGSDYSEHAYGSRQSGGPRKNFNVNSYRGSNLTISAGVATSSSNNNINNNSSSNVETSNNASNSSSQSSKQQQQPSEPASKQPAASGGGDASSNIETVDKSPSPTAPSQSPTTRPHHSPSPNPNQVQFFSGNQQQQQQPRYNNGSQRGNQTSGRYPIGNTSISNRGGGGKGANLMRQSSGGKYRINGIVHASGKLPVNETSLGGAGDAPPVGMMPITPPGTPQQQQPPQQTSSGDQQQINESCHQMQALSL